MQSKATALEKSFLHEDIIPSFWYGDFEDVVWLFNQFLHVYSAILCKEWVAIWPYMAKISGQASNTLRCITYKKGSQNKYIQLTCTNHFFIRRAALQCQFLNKWNLCDTFKTVMQERAAGFSIIASNYSGTLNTWGNIQVSFLSNTKKTSWPGLPKTQQVGTFMSEGMLCLVSFDESTVHHHLYFYYTQV